MSEEKFMSAVLDQAKITELRSDLHAVAQPLTALQGYLELALTGPRTSEDYRRTIRRALSEAERLGSCFDRIRELVRFSSAPDNAKLNGRSDIAGTSRADEMGCAHV